MNVGTKDVAITRYVLHPAKQLFYADKITRFELGDVILRNRCYDKSRPDMDRILQSMGLDEYDVYKMCRKTHGIMAQDFIWFRYEGETLEWKDIRKLRK